MSNAIILTILLAAVPAPASALDWEAAGRAARETAAAARSEITEFARVPLAELEAERPLAVKKINLGGTEYSLTLAFDYRKDNYVEIYPSARPELAQNWHIDRVAEGVVYGKAGPKIAILAGESDLRFAVEDTGETLTVGVEEFVTAVHAGARKIHFDWVPYALIRNTDPLNGEKSVVLMRLGKNGNFYHFAGYDMTLTHGWAQWFIPIKDKFYGMTMQDGHAVFMTKPFHIDTGEDERPPLPARAY